MVALGTKKVPISPDVRGLFATLEVIREVQATLPADVRIVGGEKEGDSLVCVLAIDPRRRPQ